MPHVRKYEVVTLLDQVIDLWKVDGFTSLGLKTEKIKLDLIEDGLNLKC